MNVFRRKEDDRLIRGLGHYVDDEGGSSVFHMKLVRSPYAHARIVGIDVSRAQALDGVLCTLSGAEVAAQTKKFIQMAPPPASEIVDYCMATDKVRFQGEPVVAVVATSAALAADAVELVRVDYEPLPAVTDAVQSLTNEILLHESAGTNTTWGTLFDWGDVDKAFAEAEIITESEDRAVFVPIASIVTFAGVERVMTVHDGKSVEKRVQTGRRFGDRVEIVEGIRPEELVVVEPGNLVGGQPVTVSP